MHREGDRVSIGLVFFHFYWCSVLRACRFSLCACAGYAQ